MDISNRILINLVAPILFVCVALIIGASEVAAKDCLSCHGDQPESQLLVHRAHGQTLDARLPGGSAMCQSCHGASASHLENPRKAAPDNAFGLESPLSASQRSKVCSSCHEGGHQKSWPVSEHASADVACDSCHSIHSREDPVQNKRTESQVCYSCHQAQKADGMKFSRHPVNEGIVSCSDCHNPHGGKGVSMLQEATVNETCYQCHTEKRGPFLWEHEPVQDDCTNCHTPHGSVNDNMLVIRQPLLCQQCHVGTSHRGTNYIKQGFVSGDDHVYGKACLNCHGEIHGTNHAQGGAYFE